MEKKQRLFEQLCAKHFKFLIERYGFKKLKPDKDAYGCRVTYIGKTTGVKVSYEYKDGGLFVLLARLINGKMPPYPVFVKPDSVLNQFYLEDIVAVKHPSFQLKQNFDDIVNPTLEELESSLSNYAEALQIYGQDILKGDFSIFSKLEERVKKRAEGLRKQD